MKSYFSQNRTAGLVSLIVFVLCITFGSSMSLSHGLLFFLLGLIISAASFYAINLIVTMKDDESWLALVPFAVMAVLTSLLLGWDINLPFLLCGLLAVGVSAVNERISRIREKKTDSDITFAEFSPVLLILGVILLSSALFICICAFVKVFA